MSRPFDFLSYERGSLFMSGVSLETVATEIGTPTYVYSAEALLKPLRELREGLSEISHKICFAVKSNSNLSVLKLLSEAGAGMDIVSGGELYRAEKIGAHADKIIFSGVGKTASEMKQALTYGPRGIFAFNVESLAELSQLNEIAGTFGRPARVSLRFNPDVDAKTHPYISTGLKKNKFGLDRAEILEAVKRWKDFPNIRFTGISIHIGSQILSLAPVAEAFALAKKLMLELNKILPHSLSFVDLGGGLGIAYKNEKPPQIAKYCELVVKSFGSRTEFGRPITVVIEPGRLLTGNSGVLLSRVILRKPRNKKDFLIIDAAMNDLIRPALYESHHEIVSVKPHGGKSKKTDIVGPVCETGDFFALDRETEAQLGSGDLVAILSCGAYGFTMSSNYNSRARPAEVLIRHGKFKVIRERETYSDLTRGELL